MPLKLFLSKIFPLSRFLRSFALLRSIPSKFLGLLRYSLDSKRWANDSISLNAGEWPSSQESSHSSSANLLPVGPWRRIKVALIRDN